MFVVLMWGGCVMVFVLVFVIVHGFWLFLGLLWFVVVCVCVWLVAGRRSLSGSDLLVSHVYFVG